MTRYEFLRLIVPLSVGCMRPVPLRARGQATDARVSGVSRVIEQYDRQGIHRTATAVDHESASWLMGLAQETGASATTQPFTVDRIDVRTAVVEYRGSRVDGLPLFDGTFTTAQGVEGRIGDAGSNAEIGLAIVDAAGISSEGRSIEAFRTHSAHRAIIVVTRGPHPGLSPINAPRFTRPFGVPAIQVSSEEAAWLQQLAGNQAIVRVVADATRTKSEALNVVATVRGIDESLAPIVVITPRSGWWNCASERGGGIACWLEAMRATAAARAPRTALFVASSGHELGHLGLDSFIATREALVKGAYAWVHLGANIGAAGGQARLQASDDAIEKRMADALARTGASAPQRVPRGTVPAGEARNIHIGGGRYISVLGSGPRFHNQADRWPGAVDPAAVARFASGIADLAVGLVTSKS